MFWFLRIKKFLNLFLIMERDFGFLIFLMGGNLNEWVFFVVIFLMDVLFLFFGLWNDLDLDKFCGFFNIEDVIVYYFLDDEEVYFYSDLYMWFDRLERLDYGVSLVDDFILEICWEWNFLCKNVFLIFRMFMVVVMWDLFWFV